MLDELPCKMAILDRKVVLLAIGDPESRGLGHLVSLLIEHQGLAELQTEASRRFGKRHKNAAVQRSQGRATILNDGDLGSYINGGGEVVAFDQAGLYNQFGFLPLIGASTDALQVERI